MRESRRKMICRIRYYGAVNALLFLPFITLALPGLVCSLLEEERKATFLTAAVGEAVAFNCQLDFPHDVVIPYILNWNKEGQTVFTWYEGVLTAKEPYKGRVRLLPPDSPYGKGSINLTSIRESDGGWYECRISFPNRSPSTRHNGTWFHLTVDGGNLLAIPPINQTSMEGESAHFPCVTKDRASTVTWYKDGINLADLQDISVRSFISPEGSLTISPTDMEDLGEYTCEVTNPSGEKQAATAYLNVQYKAKVVYAPKEIYLPFGRPALLDCHFRANPPLTNLRWEKDGFLFDPYNVQGVFYRRNGSLYFSKIDETHGGQYTCTPFNELGTEGPSPIMHVAIQRPPVFTITPHNLYLRRKGDSVEMPCDALDGGDGKQRTTIVWFKKDGTPLPSGRTSIVGGNLTVENIDEDDRGVYQCVASNEAATISVESELMIENIAPRAPYNLSAEATEDSVTVRWQSGFTRPKMEFSAWYRLTDSQTWRALPVLSRGVTELTIDKLQPGREYEVMVLSQDMHGEGMFSKAIRVKTQGEPVLESPIHQFHTKPDGGAQGQGVMSPPQNINVALTEKGYLVTWDPPEANRDMVQYYKVSWFQGMQLVSAGTANTQDNYHLVDDLEEDETYSFQVLVVYNNDLEVESTKFLIHVPSFKKVRAISLGIGLGFVFLLLAVLIGWFVRRNYIKNRLNQRGKQDCENF